jgi:plasmid stabilization system protein ParE
MTHAVFLPEAEREMLEAALYYQSQATRLGIDFLSEVERAVQSIAESPDTWPVLEGEVRRRLIRRFPLGVLYRVEPEEIVVIAVAHLRRKPCYWKEIIQKR